ncbi:uncharacterized protein LOC117546280 isoform X3 [Gymnodraco acuticeps]|uniref:Uncharacterized protein LOC117546280 isoform X3 n=1 Tax=Gymnodraco acuticeps TaxID=8218 RepID=A0A6P8V548_GYMAC|nr:uncharacterized protein LOC117546280 isoform X3 [Gymnodraco acuticeps]
MSGVVHLGNIMTDENENGTQEFNSVMNRVFNALDVARRDLAAQRNDNVLRVTRSTFRRRRRAPTTGASNESAGVWRVRLFLLALADQSVLPAPTESSRLSREGLGIPAHDQQGVVSERSYVKLSMTLLEFNSYVCQSFPTIPLNMIGFTLARAGNSRLLTQLQATTMADLKRSVGRSRVYIIPQADIPTLLVMASSSASAALRPAGAPSASAASTSATDSEGAASAASTLATDSEGAPSASAASTLATDSEGAPSASAASTLATDSEGAPSASAASTSAATETAGSTTAPTPPSTSVSMDADVESLHSAQWVNAGTPEVFYRRSRLEQPNRNSFNDFLIDDSDEEEEGEDEAFGTLESYVFPVILQCKTAEDLSALQQDLGDWISECGIPGIFSATIGEIPKIYSYVVKHYIFLRTAKMVNQFTEGMNAFGNLWDLVRNNWIAFVPCFTNMRTPLTKSSFKAILKYEYSPRGTNHREKEEDTIYSWELVLNLIEDKLTELTFEDLLIFITGADEVPTLGFPNKPSIDFYTQEAGVRRLPYASTCAMTLFLPRGITEEQELHNILNQSVKDSLGFLKV